MKQQKNRFDTTSDDEYTERLRLRTIESGQIVPDEGYVSRHPNMSLERVKALRERLVASGSIIPRTGTYRRGKRPLQ
jgi:hypothetical protein